MMLLAASLSTAAVRAQSVLVDSTVYLPLVMRNYNPYAALRTVNAPYLNVADITGSKLAEMAIFWFGQVTPSENYTDVRIAYNTTELVVYIASFDRRLWYDTTPSANDLTQWDSATLYLSLDGNIGGAPSSNTYRFDAQLTNGGTLPSASKASFRGAGGVWTATPITFTGSAGWRGDQINNNADSDDRGLALTFRIPFSSLGVSTPASGATWGLAVVAHDRDSLAGPALADKTWPEVADGNSPSTWGRLRFGTPVYTPPASTNPQITMIRQGLSGATVVDTAVGGTLGNLCNADGDFWNQWGSYNDAGDTGANIQNQADIADWPCFSKYFVTFPLDQIPAGKVIRSATLTLHHWGNTGDINSPKPEDRPQPSYIHVATLVEGWTEATLTWNTAPLAFENVSQAWVPPVTSCNWPCVPRNWDVSRAVAQAYASGQPLRLALYSSDSDYHSGKFFTTSDTENWNAEGRPTLTIEHGTP
jgi:hypothetical protein